MFTITKESLRITQEISDKIDNKTFHHHYHILYDIANSYGRDSEITYLEIGCYAGGSACLMLQRPNTKVISIDIGKPILKSEVLTNVNNLNKHKNSYTYIEGDSKNENTVAELHKNLNGQLIDILFIDGNHSYHGVQNDFIKYNKYVKPGGYIIFDDYNDRHSPEVKPAVDGLDLSGFIVIGEFGNEFGARSQIHPPNEFVIRKEIPIAIVTPTYYRPDGKTEYLLSRMLFNLMTQKYKNFKLYLIGDNYSDHDEFNKYSNYNIQMYTENLPYAEERNKLKGYPLWCVGGVNAVNTGIKKALADGYEWIIILDHDDYLKSNHILDIFNEITLNSVFVCSLSNVNSLILPTTKDKNFIPRGGELIKSSACVKFSKINMLFKNTINENGTVYPSDADFWDRLGKLIDEKKYDSFCTLKNTCIHEDEGYTITNLN
jgi:hypothetical protein